MMLRGRAMCDFSPGNKYTSSKSMFLSVTQLNFAEKRSAIQELWLLKRFINGLLLEEKIQIIPQKLVSYKTNYEGIICVTFG